MKLILISFTAILATLSFAKQTTIQLPFKSVQNMKDTAEGWQAIKPIYKQNKDGFCIEAEKASSLLSQSYVPNKKTDKKAGSNIYLSNPTALRFDLLADKEGVFSLNIRIRKNKDFKATTVKEANIVGSPNQADVTYNGRKLITERFKAPDEKWGWQKLTSLQIKPGYHNITISPLPGYDFDKLAIVKASPKDFRGDLIPGRGAMAEKSIIGTAEKEELDTDLLDLELSEKPKVNLDKLKESQPYVTRKCSAVTYEISPLSVKQWEQLNIEGNTNECPPLIEFSNDHGKTWQKATLSTIKCQDNGSDYLKIRLTWEPKDRVPLVKSIQVGYLAGENPGQLIEGSKMSLLLSKKTGAIYDIIRNDDQKSLSLPMKRPLFSIMSRNSNFIQAVNSNSFQLTSFEKQEKSWHLKFSFTERNLAAECTITPASQDAKEWFWSISVDNQSKATVEGTLFPNLPNLYISGTSLLPQSLWSPRGKGVFPGSLSMGFVFTASNDEGLYLASRDKSLVAVELEASQHGPLTSVSASSFGVIPPKQQRQFDYSIAYLPPDWHDAADLYRKWAFSWMKRPQFPQWAKLNDGWWTIGSDSEAALLDRRSTTILEDALWFGLPHMQFWLGCGDGSFVGRMPYLSPRLGTPEMSKKDSERIQNLGGHIGHYIQGREWDASYYDADILWFIPRKFYPKDFTVEDYDWSNRNACNGPWQGKKAGLRIMSPMSAEWRQHIAKHAKDRVQLFGNDTAYFDQMGCTVMTDRNPAHGPEYHASGVGYTRMAQEILKEMRSINPNVAIAQEGMNAATGQYVHFHLASCLPYPDFGKQFLYTFPDTALVHGYGNGVFSQTDGNLGKFMRSRFLLNRFELPRFDIYIRELVLLRKRIHDWQYNGQFMDDNGLETYIGDKKQELPTTYYKTSQLIAKWFLLDHTDEKGILLTFQNEPEFNNGVVRIDTKNIPFALNNKAFFYSIDGSAKVIDANVEKDQICLNIPAERVGAILIPGQVTGAKALRTFAFQHIDNPELVTLTAVNISNKPINAQWEISAPTKLDPSSGSADLKPFSVYMTLIKFLGIDKANALENAQLKWSFSGINKTDNILITPIVRNKSFELDVDQNNSPDSWWNFNKTLGHIIHRFAHDVDLFTLPAKVDSTVKHSGQSSVRVNPAIEYKLSVDGAFGRKGTQMSYPGDLSQHLYHLKPNSTYKISVWAYSSQQNAKVKLTVDRKYTEKKLPPNQWIKLELEYKTPSKITETILTLSNKSPKGTYTWFDDVEIEEKK